MEEKHSITDIAPPKRQHAISFEWRNAGWVCVGAAVMWLAMRSSTGNDKFTVTTQVTPAVHRTESTFSWKDTPSYHHLSYTDCFEGHQCARLRVPMDHLNGSTNATVDLALIRRPATVPVTDPRYGGVVLLNPGGPGGSGVDFLLRVGLQIQNIIGSNDTDGKQFDVLSFDPRGIGQTVPRVQCFESPAADQSFLLRYGEEGLLDSSNAALGRMWAMATAKGQTCTVANNPDYDVDFKKYVSTAYVARDMLEIVERHGEWREREAAKLLRRQTGRLAAAAVPASLKYQTGKEKIQYWGFSYGSYLGNTFAAMFPDRIQRLIVDGVVDADNYRGALWSNNLVDTEKTMNQFYHHCARVGYPTCMLASQNGTDSAKDVQKRVKQIVQGLYHNPLPVIGANAEVVTYSDLRQLIFGSLYSPMKSYPGLAALLAQVGAGNGTEFAARLFTQHTYDCKIDYLHENDAPMAIACSDGDDQSDVDVQVFHQHIKDLAKASPTIGTIWSQIRLQCIHYTVRAKYRFVGPWKAKTSHPLLMIGNTADPVTPAAYAHKMAAGFDGAVALIQDSAGHCSSSAFSNCTVQYVKRYFQTGALPPPNTTCTVDELPFGPGPNATLAIESQQLVNAREQHASIMDGLQQSGGLFMQHLHLNDMV